MSMVPFVTPTLVRGVAARAFATSPYSRTVVRAYANRKAIKTVGGFLYRNRDKIKRMAKRRAANISNKAGIGVQPGAGTSQKEQMLNGNAALFDSRTLYANELTLIGKATGANEINTRQRQIINVSGFSVSGMFVNNDTKHMFINCAILSPRNNNATTIQADGFFRDYNASRDINFSLGLSGYRMAHLPVSTDKFRVLAHTRLRCGAAALAGDGGGLLPANQAVSNTASFKIWCPLKRNLTYNDDTTNDCEAKVFFVFWMTDTMAQADAAVIDAQVTGAIHAVTYYTEVAAPQRTGGRFDLGNRVRITNGV